MFDGRTIHLDFESDYTDKGLCPGHDHEIILMGPEAINLACKPLFEYDGTQVAPLQLKMACAIFLNYLLESVKLHDVHYFNSLSLLHGSLCTLDECDPTLSLLMKRWSRLSEPQIIFVIQMLYSQSEALSKVKGIENLKPVIHVVAITPFNRIPKLDGNARTWSCFTQD